MKLLNLDDINLDSERTVKYRDVSYPVRDFNVSEFIKFQKHFNAFNRAYTSTEEADLPKVIEETKNLVAVGIPTFPTDLVETLNPIQMLALVSMIANLLPEPDAETTEAAAAATGGDAKKAEATEAVTAE